MPTCKGCGQEIIWVKTGDGKNMPLDPKPKKMIFLPESAANPGTKVACFVDAYMPHWSTCPKADNFRKPKEG